MGRKLRRVPLDFDWPIGKIWHGYINPYYRKCPDCDNGYTAARERLQDLISLIMLSGTDSQKGQNHPYFVNNFALYHNNIIPSPDMAELTIGLAGRNMSFIGHDACDKWSAEKKIIKAAGLDPDIWGICKFCNGDAIDPAIKSKYEAWELFDPPTGEGYQLWDTTGDGSPISPVFAILDDLCNWCESNATTFAYNKTTAAEWKRMLSEDFVIHKEGNIVFM